MVGTAGEIDEVVDGLSAIPDQSDGSAIRTRHRTGASPNTGVAIAGPEIQGIGKVDGPDSVGPVDQAAIIELAAMIPAPAPDTGVDASCADMTRSTIQRIDVRQSAGGRNENLLWIQNV